MDRRVLAAVLGSGYGSGGSCGERVRVEEERENSVLATALRKEYE